MKQKGEYLNELIDYERISIQKKKSYLPGDSEIERLIGPISISQSPNMGRCVIADREISKGELLLCVPAYYVFYPDSASFVTPTHQFLVHIRNLIQRISSDGELIRPLLYLFDPDTKEDPLIIPSFNDLCIKREAEDPVLEISSDKMGRILRSNGFGGEFNGVWIESSFFNHACVSNAFYIVVSNIMLIYADTTIAQGEQIFISYINPDTRHSRQNDLLFSFGFECKCYSCSQICCSKFEEILTDIDINLMDSFDSITPTSHKYEINQLSRTYSVVRENCQKIIDESNIYAVPFEAIRATSNILFKLFLLQNYDLCKEILQWLVDYLIIDSNSKFQMLHTIYHKLIEHNEINENSTGLLKITLIQILENVCGMEAFPLFEILINQVEELEFDFN